MKLIKLENKFILVSDEQPVKSWYFDTYINKVKNTNNAEYAINDITKQIIAGIPELPSIDFSLLSEEDCKKIGWVDIEKLAADFANTELADDNGLLGNFYSLRTSFLEGFKTAQSLNDKMFSLDDMKTLMHESIKFSEENQYLSIGEYAIKHYNWWNNKIQSLQQTSWNVEVNEKNQITKIYSKEDL